MRTGASFLLSISVLVLGGCSSLSEKLVQAGDGVAAEPLYVSNADGSISLPNNPVHITASANTPNADVVWGYVILSEAKCTKFLNGIVAAETGSDTLLDMESTLFSALSTAFTPVGTKSALSAAATVTGGWKTAIDSDVFAKASIANFAQAITSSYFKDMGNYGTDLSKMTEDTKIYPAAEFAKIQTIHAECALAPAQATISTTLTAGATAPTGSTGGGGATPAGSGMGAASTTTAPSSATGFVVPGHPIQPSSSPPPMQQ